MRFWKLESFGQIVLPVHGIAQVQTAEEIVVLARRRPHLLIQLQVLQVSLYQRGTRLQEM